MEDLSFRYACYVLFALLVYSNWSVSPGMGMWFLSAMVQLNKADATSFQVT